MKKTMKRLALLLAVTMLLGMMVACDTAKEEEKPETTPEVGTVTDNGDGTVTTVMQLNNPILPGYHADPSACKFGDTYYIYSTTDGYVLGGNAGWPMIWKSTDFVNWSAEKMEIVTEDGKPYNDAGNYFWAPSVVQVGEKYCLFFTMSDYKIIVAVGDTPEGPFVVQGDDLFPKYKTIDPQGFVDDDGSLYVTYLLRKGDTDDDLYTAITKLNPEDPTEIIETKEIDELSHAYREGQEIFKKDGKYYLLYSEGVWTGTDYHVVYAMADNVYGPYTVQGTILESADANLVGTGHNSTLKISDDRYVLVYHRQSIPFIGFGFRQVCVDDMIFNEDGTIQKVQASYDGIVLDVTQPKEVASLKNVAAGATVTYDSDQKESIYRPAYLVDDSYQTLFKTGDDDGDKEILIELDNVYDIKKTELCFEFGSKFYRYLIEVSEDNENWTVYADKTKSKERVTPCVDEGEVRAKYIRITLTAHEALSRNYGSKTLSDAQRWKEPVRYGIFEFKAYAEVTE